MDIITMLGVFCGVLVLFSIALLIALLKSSNRIIEINKQLLIVVAGRDEKPEALRALVASNRPPRKNLAGIAGTQKGKNDKPKSTNQNYTMKVGVNNGRQV